MHSFADVVNYNRHDASRQGGHSSSFPGRIMAFARCFSVLI